MNVKQKLGIAVVVVASSLALAFVWVITNNPADAATLTSITFQGVSSTSTCSAGTGVIYYDSASGALKFCNGSTPGVFTSISTSTGGYWLATGTAIYSQSSAVAIGLNNPSATTMLQVMGADSLNTSQALVASGRTGAQFVVTNTGNVGIGTTNPGAQLQVSASTNSWMYLTSTDITNGSTVKIGAVSSNGRKEGQLQYETNFNVFDVTAAASRLFINSSGNVGVGTTTPTTALSVVGSILSAGSRPITINGVTGAITAQGDAGGWAFGFHAKGSAGTDRGGFGFFGGADTLSYYYIGAAYNTPTMIIGTGANSNVGISTTTALTARLVISPGNQPSIDAGSQRIINVATPTGANEAANKTYVDSVMGGYWTASGTAIYSNNTGNVGIGTTTPTRAKLETAGMVGNTTAVFGTDLNGVSLIANWPGIAFNGYYNGGQKSLAPGYTSSIWGSATDGHIEFRNGTTSSTAPGQAVAETTTFYILNNGNVGLGVSPTQKLHVVATSTNDGINLTDGAKWLRQFGGTLGAGSYNQISQAGDSGFIYSAGQLGTGGLVIGPWSASAVGIRMDGSGNVGIGTPSPAATLDVNGAIAQNGYIQIKSSVSSFSAGYLAGGSTGTYNVAIGYNSLRLNGGGSNTAVGYGTLSGVSGIGSMGNTAVGFQALGTSTTSGLHDNTAVGAGALANTVGAYNIAVGSGAGNALTTGNYNVFIGSYQAAPYKTGSNNIFLSDGMGTLRILNDATGYTTFYGGTGNNTGVMDFVSDRRLKRDIAPIEGALNTVAALQGVNFNWKDPEKNATYGRIMGFIAQDVEKVLPQWVKTDKDGYKSLSKIGVEALLVEAIKEQEKKIDALTKEVEVLKNK